MPSFFVINEEGEQVSDDFTSWNKAVKECKKMSEENKGRFEVSVAISTVIYENGVKQAF